VFIVVEGIEGSGKSTLVNELARTLRSDGHEVVTTREPGGTPLGNAVRQLFLTTSAAMTPLTEALLVNAARAQHVSAVIGPALSAGRTVVCDRFTDSTLAYQGYGRGLPLNDLQRLCDLATGEVNPDLVLVLDVPVSVGRARMRERAAAADRIESEDDGFHERVRQGFLELAARPSHTLLDGTLPTAHLVEQAVRAAQALATP